MAYCRWALSLQRAPSSVRVAGPGTTCRTARWTNRALANANLGCTARLQPHSLPRVAKEKSPNAGVKGWPNLRRGKELEPDARQSHGVLCCFFFPRQGRPRRTNRPAEHSAFVERPTGALTTCAKSQQIIHCVRTPSCLDAGTRPPEADQTIAGPRLSFSWEPGAFFYVVCFWGVPESSCSPSVAGHI